MDISSTTSQVNTSVDTAVSTKPQKASVKGDSSFKEAMTKVSDNKATETDVKPDQKTSTTIEQKTDATTKQKTGVITERNAGLKPTVSQTEKQNVAVKTQVINQDMIKASVTKNFERVPDLSQTNFVSRDINAPKTNIPEQNVKHEAKTVVKGQNIPVLEVLSDYVNGGVSDKQEAFIVDKTGASVVISSETKKSDKKDVLVDKKPEVSVNKTGKVLAVNSVTVEDHIVDKVSKKSADVVKPVRVVAEEIPQTPLVQDVATPQIKEVEKVSKKSADVVKPVQVVAEEIPQTPLVQDVATPQIKEVEKVGKKSVDVVKPAQVVAEEIPQTIKVQDVTTSNVQEIEKVSRKSAKFDKHDKVAEEEKPQTINVQDVTISNIQAQALIDAKAMLSKTVSDTKIPVKVDYTTIKMDMNDAQFFTELVQDTDNIIQNVVNEITQNAGKDVKEAQKNVKVSATLMNALCDAVQNKQSFRIDFDKDVSVIIKVDREGAVSARFIPGDNAVEQYLKQNISALRQRFDEQDLAYNELSYTGQQKRNKKQNNDNKENGHE